jgi:hypothetical protein
MKRTVNIGSYASVERVRIYLGEEGRPWPIGRIIERCIEAPEHINGS